MDSSLSLNQFQSYMTVIRNMLDKIEQEQTNKLRSINDVKGENMSQQVTLGRGWTVCILNMLFLTFLWLSWKKKLVTATFLKYLYRGF